MLKILKTTIVKMSVITFALVLGTTPVLGSSSIKTDSTQLQPRELTPVPRPKLLLWAHGSKYINANYQGFLFDIAPCPVGYDSSSPHFITQVASTDIGGQTCPIRGVESDIGVWLHSSGKWQAYAQSSNNRAATNFACDDLGYTISWQFYCASA